VDQETPEKTPAKKNHAGVRGDALPSIERVDGKVQKGARGMVKQEKKQNWKTGQDPQSS